MSSVIKFRQPEDVGGYLRVRRLSVAELKALWDAPLEKGEVVDGIWIEAVHEELNRRGEGNYCAV